MENSEIAWTTHTFNPWRGCAKVSEGCKHCYAEAQTRRYGLPLWGATAERRVAAESSWKNPLRWDRLAKEAGQRHRVFCASMADVFEPRPDLAAPRARLARLIEKTPNLDWLLLTKRPEHMAQLAKDAGWSWIWPFNVWAGTTVENQHQAHERIPQLLQVPVLVRFLSVEPLLGPVDLDPPICDICGAHDDGLFVDSGDGHTYCKECGDDSAHEASFDHWLDPCASVNKTGVSWVIVGGESGPGARPFDLAWARSIRDQCKAAGVPFFMKQIGARAIDGALGSLVVSTKHPKGGDPSEWPEDLRVQEFPTSLQGCP
jgi:protein gp37